MQRTKRPTPKSRATNAQRGSRSTPASRRMPNTHSVEGSIRDAKQALVSSASAYAAAARQLRATLVMMAGKGMYGEGASLLMGEIDQALEVFKSIGSRQLVNDLHDAEGVVTNLLIGSLAHGMASTEVKYASMTQDVRQLRESKQLLDQLVALDSGVRLLWSVLIEVMGPILRAGRLTSFDYRVQNPDDDDAEEMIQMFAVRLAASSPEAELREVLRLAEMATDTDNTPLARMMSLLAAERAFGIAVAMSVYEPSKAPADLTAAAVEAMLTAEADTINQLFMTEDVDMTVTAADHRVARQVFEEIMRSQRGAQPGPGAPGRGGRRRNSTRVSAALGSASGAFVGSLVGGTLGIIGGPTTALVMYAIGGVVGAAAGAQLFTTIPSEELKTARLVSALGAIATFPLPPVGAAYGTYIVRGEQTLARHDRELKQLKASRESNQDTRRLQKRLME